MAGFGIPCTVREQCHWTFGIRRSLHAQMIPYNPIETGSIEQGKTARFRSLVVLCVGVVDRYSHEIVSESRAVFPSEVSVLDVSGLGSYLRQSF